MDDVTRPALADLVAIPSVNPMGRALSGPEFLETRLTDYLEDWFRDAGRPLSSASRSRPGGTTCWPGTSRPARGGRSSSTSTRTPCRPTG